MGSDKTDAERSKVCSIFVHYIFYLFQQMKRFMFMIRSFSYI